LAQAREDPLYNEVHVCRYRFIPHIATVATLALFGVFDYQRLKSFIVKALKHLAQTYTSSKDDQPSFLLLEPLILIPCSAQGMRRSWHGSTPDPTRFLRRLRGKSRGLVKNAASYDLTPVVIPLH
jgi:hypothetical protein